MSTDLPPLLVFADDWGRHPSSCQHLVARVLGSRQVAWVNTIGTRPPRLDATTFRRATGKIVGWLRPASDAGDREDPKRASSPIVVSPRMWPSFERSAYRRLNRRLLLGAIGSIVERLGAPPDVLSTLPITADLVGGFPARSWTYYCVDDFGTWPGYYGDTLALMERELVPRVDLVVAASERLAEQHRADARCLQLLTHGVDLDTWRAAPGAPLPDAIRALPRPWVVFWGLVDRRMDLGWVEALSNSLDRGTIVMIGPHDAPDPGLAKVPRVAFLPSMGHDALAVVADRADVLVMPYADLPATRAMQPLKLKEYLATGRPVVVRALPATEPWSDACDACADADGFVRAVHASIRDGVPAGHAAARRRLADESWNAKSRELFGWIAALAPTTAGRHREAVRTVRGQEHSGATRGAVRASRGEPG